MRGVVGPLYPLCVRSNGDAPLHAIIA